MCSIKTNQDIIAPIAIDVGAAHTGVFRAKYLRGTTIDNISERHGEVLNLDSKKYTLLMRDRTANRHMRRGLDRRKLAKRLLALILQNYFNFPEKAHRQATGHFLNRRGFSRLEETFDPEILAQFPQDAWDVLPQEAKELLKSHESLLQNFNDLVNQKPEAINKLDTLLIKETIQAAKSRSRTLKYVKKLQTAIANRNNDKENKEGKKEPNKLSETPAWVVKALIDAGVSALTTHYNEQKATDLLTVGKQTKDIDELAAQLETAKHHLSSNNTALWSKITINHNHILEKISGKLANDKTRIEGHLINLIVAIHHANSELSSGSRHRRKYFEEIQKDIGNAASHPHKYMQRFSAAIDGSKKLDKDKLYHLIAHISNLELKPLRAYFNSYAHRNGDQWNPERLTKHVSRWFLKQWRVSEAKDGQEKYQRYQELRKQWLDHPKDKGIVEFWMSIDPELTIPPYQSHTNRNPPACQSLILDADYMNDNYPHWKSWLYAMNSDLAPDLASVTRRNSKEPLTTVNQRKLRQLQFLLDRSQKADPYKLNLIWSQHHCRQKHRQGSKEYKDADASHQRYIKESTLPSWLKETLRTDFYAIGGEESRQSFAHFLNQYYQCRKKAKRGRYFLHPGDHHKLLALCPHRPRQKHYQTLMDFAAIVGIPPAELKKICKTRSLEDFLREIKGFPSNAERAAKVQKQYRGKLKDLLLERKNAELNKLVNRVKELATTLAERLWDDLDDAGLEKKSSRFDSVFSFAQIYNLVFIDRTGFSNTCPVCSADNAGRMTDENDHARASRLPALSMRVIDGAVKRLLSLKAGKIADLHWKLIGEALREETNSVCVPLIFEKNSFAFEQSLRDMKGAKSRKIDKADEKHIDSESEESNDSESKEPNDSKSKQQRITRAVGDICPYEGSPLVKGGEKEHIIPRASVYGTLNDEANLLYASKAGNKNKNNRTYHLDDLNTEYKRLTFKLTGNDQIKDWIHTTLTGQAAGTDPHFEFGTYQSFINLTDEQPKAFRHALFLADDDPVRKLVLRAIQNRNRTYVNGTQRFFAQLIADCLNRRHRAEQCKGVLSFDYFEFSADPKHPNSVHNLRARLDIEKVQPQDDYSHLVDAHMAFLLACEDHRDNGSMGVDFGSTTSVWPAFADGDVTAYTATRVTPDEMTVIDIERKSTNNKVSRYIKADSNAGLKHMKLRQLFKQEAIGRSYRPIVCYQDKWYVGYPKAVKGGYDLSAYAKETDPAKAEAISSSKYYQLTHTDDDLRIYSARKEDGKRVIDIEVEKYLSSNGTKEYGENDKEPLSQLTFILTECRVYLHKTPLLQAPTVINTQKKGVGHPCIEEWRRFDQAWKRIAGDGYRETKSNNKRIYKIGNGDLKEKWYAHCKEFLRIDRDSQSVQHLKHRSVYSMIAPATPSGSVLQINRRGKGIYQAVPIDHSELPKKLIPFLIKESNYLSWPHSKARDWLNKPLETYNKKEIDQTLSTKQFFTEELCKEIQPKSDIVITAENTKITVKNFPIGLLKVILTLRDEKPDSSYEIRADGKTGDYSEHFAKKSVIDNWFRPRCRDGRLKVLSITDSSCNFELPYRYKTIKKHIQNLK